VQQLKNTKLEVHVVETCRDARVFVGDHPSVDLVVTEVSLADGNWADIVRYVVDHAEKASIVVACSTPDEQFWSEILWRGVYDLLIEPYDLYQVRRVVEGAIRRAHRPDQQTLRRPADSAAAGAGANGTRFDRAGR
jgi:DNA-binding NtrC family response regulator